MLLSVLVLLFFWRHHTKTFAQSNLVGDRADTANDTLSYRVQNKITAV